MLNLKVSLHFHICRDTVLLPTSEIRPNMMAYDAVLCATKTTYSVLLGCVALSHQTENVALERSYERVVQLQVIYFVLDIREKIWNPDIFQQ